MIQPGLERIGMLLRGVDLPWKSIHVAGTNGKGSISNYAYQMLRRRRVRTGMFTSPHLVDRWDCIQIMDKPVGESAFLKVEKHFKARNEREDIQASEFELLTATAFQLFNDEQVDVGVVEVGMGGRLDATNILDNQLVSIISKVARDHDKFLGSTLEEIAGHKAGILRPHVPYAVNPMNEWNVSKVIDDVAHEVGAGPRLDEDAGEVRRCVLSTSAWEKAADRLAPFQRDNLMLAVLAVREALRYKDGRGTQALLNACRLLQAVTDKSFPGRCQHVLVPPIFHSPEYRILVDGAHNVDAAKALDGYVTSMFRTDHRAKGFGKYLRTTTPKDSRPVTWVIAMSQGRNAQEFLGSLLSHGDNVVITTFGPVAGMPWVKSMDPADIYKTIESLERNITAIIIPERGAFRALMAAKYLTEERGAIVLTGSLYLVGDFWREERAFNQYSKHIDVALMDRQERNRVNTFLSRGLGTQPGQGDSNQDAIIAEEQEKQKLQREIDRLTSELKNLDDEATTINESSSRHASNLVLPPRIVPSPGTERAISTVTTKQSQAEAGAGTGTNEPPHSLIRKHFTRGLIQNTFPTSGKITFKSVEAPQGKCIRLARL